MELPTGWNLKTYHSEFFGCLCGELTSPDGKGLLFPIPPDGLNQQDIAAAVNEIENPESAPIV